MDKSIMLTPFFSLSVASGTIDDLKPAKISAFRWLANYEYPGYPSRWLSCLTQNQALRQPNATPITKKVNVQEGLPGKWESSQTPSAMPIKVGMATDQPTSPNIPSPNQAVCLRCSCARRLRSARWPMVLSSDGLGLKPLESPGESATEFLLQFPETT
jgi:hypothetical protein